MINSKELEMQRSELLLSLSDTHTLPFLRLPCNCRVQQLFKPVNVLISSALLPRPSTLKLVSLSLASGASFRLVLPPPFVQLYLHTIYYSLLLPLIASESFSQSTSTCYPLPTSPHSQHSSSDPPPSHGHLYKQLTV